jgi:hypothetical protein
MRHSARNAKRQRKFCPKCEKVLPFSAFYKDKSRPDGHSGYCKNDVKAYQRERYHKQQEEES